MIKKILHKIDKQIRPKKRFFDELLIDKTKIKEPKHIVDYVSSKGSLRTMKLADKYDHVANYYFDVFKKTASQEAYHLANELRLKSVSERMGSKQFSDAFQYAKKYNIPEEKILNVTLKEINNRISTNIQAIDNFTKRLTSENIAKIRLLLKEIDFTYSWDADYAKANNYFVISNTLKQKNKEIQDKYSNILNAVKNKYPNLF